MEINNLNFNLNEVFARIPLLQMYGVDDFKVSRLAGFTNHNFHLKNTEHDWVLRIPKKETNQFINRAFEAENVNALSQSDFVPKIIWRDESGISLTANCAQARPFGREDMRDQSVLALLIDHISHLHQSNFKFSGKLDIATLVKQYFELTPEDSAARLNPYYKQLQQNLTHVEKIDACKVASHNDLVLENLLIQDGQKIYIIDWEYSAQASPYWDLATLCNTARFDLQQSQNLLELYNAKGNSLKLNVLCNYQRILQFLTVCWMAKFSGQNLDDELNWFKQIQT